MSEEVALQSVYEHGFNRPPTETAQHLQQPVQAMQPAATFSQNDLFNSLVNSMPFDNPIHTGQQNTSYAFSNVNTNHGGSAQPMNVGNAMFQQPINGLLAPQMSSTSPIAPAVAPAVGSTMAPAMQAMPPADVQVWDLSNGLSHSAAPPAPATSSAPIPIAAKPFANVNNTPIYDLTGSPDSSNGALSDSNSVNGGVSDNNSANGILSDNNSATNTPAPMAIDEPGPERLRSTSPFAKVAQPPAGPSHSTEIRIIPRSQPHVVPYPHATTDPEPSSGRIDSSSFKRNPLKRAAEGQPSSAPKGKTMTDIRAQLDKRMIQIDNRPANLFKLLRVRIVDGEVLEPHFEPNARQLVEILGALNDYASSSYLRSMADNKRHTQVIVGWLKNMRRDPKYWEPAIAPLFKLLAKTDMPLNYIRNMKIGLHGKAIMKQSEELRLKSNEEIQKQYLRMHNYFRDVIFIKKREVPDDDEEEDAQSTKKRKVEATSEAGPSRATASTQAPSRSTAAPRPPPSSANKVSTAVKVAQQQAARAAATTSSSSAAPAPPSRSDMSYFSGPSTSAPKPKPRAPLPDTKKRTAPAPAPAPVASGSSLLSSTLRMLKKEEPSHSPEPANPMGRPQGRPELKKKLNKKGHTVLWADSVPNARSFLQVKEFKEEPFEFIAPWWNEGEEEGANTSGMSAHQLDMQEGRAMLFHGIDEAVDWFTPEPYEGTREDAPITPEAQAQEERTRSVLAVSYPTGQTPATPDETGVRIVQADASTKQMYKNPEFGPGMGSHPSFNAPYAAPAAAAPPSVSDLLRNLTSVPLLSTPAAPAPAPAQQGYGYQYNQYGQPGYTPQAQQHTPAAPASGLRWGNNQNRWGNNAASGSSAYNATPYDRPPAQNHQTHHAPPSNWRGAKHHPSAPFRVKPCKYFHSGRKCFEGDNCRYLH